MGRKHNSSFWSSSRLRVTLFRIWFTKNILVFIQVALIIALVLMITGNITADTPVLGKMIYPLFSELIDEINGLAVERNMDGWMDFFSVVISISVSVSMFTIKARSIAQSDIKSIPVKKALISAGLYFNSDGKLVKKEKAVKEDTNGDGVVDHNDIQVKSNIFTGLLDAIREFIVIANADFSGNEKADKEVFDETISKADLDATAEGLDMLEHQMRGKLNLTKDNGETPDDDFEEEEEEEEETCECEHHKPGKMSRFKGWVTSNFAIGRRPIKEEDEEEYEDEYEEEEEEEIGENEMDIIENNLDEDAETDLTDTFDTEEVNSVPVEEIIEEKHIPKPAPAQKSTSPETKKPTNRRDAAVNDYLSKMRGGK